MVVLKDFLVEWGCIAEPDVKFKPTWRIDFLLTPDEAKAVFLELEPHIKKAIQDRLNNAKVSAQERTLLENLAADRKAQGVSLFTATDDGRLRLRAKRPVDGNTPPQVIDANKQPLTKGIVGRGDTVNLAVEVTAWTMAGKTAGISLRLEGVQVMSKGRGSASAKTSGPINWDGTSKAATAAAPAAKAVDSLLF